MKCTGIKPVYHVPCTGRWEVPGWLSGKESACNAGATGDAGSIPGSGIASGGGHGNPL